MRYLYQLWVMFMINKRRFLVKESLKRKILSRWFWGINIVLFLLIIISFNIDSIIRFFGGDFKDTKTLLVIDNVSIYSDFQKEFDRISEVAVTEYQLKSTSISLSELQKQVKNNNQLIGIEILPDSSNFFHVNIYSQNGLSSINTNLIQSSFNNIKKNIALKDYGITKNKMDKIEKAVDVDSIVLTDKVVNNNKDVTAAVTVITFIVPCFFLITTLVQMIGSEINEEKTTKSMEIIVSNVPAKDHLLAKIEACTIFTFVQILLLLLFVGISYLFHSGSVGTLSEVSTQGFTNAIMSDIFSKNLLTMIKSVLPILFISFCFTLVTYALLAGVLASMTTNIDDFQQLQTPLMMIISIGFYLSLLAGLFEGSIFIKIMSFIPLVSFMLSPTLYMLGQVSLSSVIISSFLEFLFLLIVYHYGIKIYRVGILNYSGEHLWRKIIKALKTN